MTQTAKTEPSRRLIILLAAALAAWGFYHAIGAFLFNHDVRRGLVVLACMAAFLGWWLLLVRYRTKKNREQSRPASAGQRYVENG
jgi:predicted permease